jgi:hypothetical protein
MEEKQQQSNCLTNLSGVSQGIENVLDYTGPLTALFT